MLRYGPLEGVRGWVFAKQNYQGLRWARGRDSQSGHITNLPKKRKTFNMAYRWQGHTRPAFAFEVLQDSQRQVELDSLNNSTLAYLNQAVRSAFPQKIGHYWNFKYIWADVLFCSIPNLNISLALNHIQRELLCLLLTIMIYQDLLAAHVSITWVFLNNFHSFLPFCMIYICMYIHWKQFKIKTKK